MTSGRVFDSTVEGKRRRVLFGLALTTALITLFSASTTFIISRANISVVLVLLAVSTIFVGFAVFVYAGRLTGLFTDDQLFWHVLEVDE